MADKRIIELEERSTLVNNDFIATDNTNGTAKVNGAILGQKKDSASLALYGSTNTSGSTITSGTFFYLNGNLVKALANIAANASFTLNTNYKVVSIGEELSQLNNDLQNMIAIETVLDDTITVPASGYVAGREVSIPPKTGYTCFLAVLKSTGNVRSVINVISIDTANKITYTVLNTSSSQQSAQVSFYVYYKKN